MMTLLLRVYEDTTFAQKEKVDSVTVVDHTLEFQ